MKTYLLKTKSNEVMALVFETKEAAEKYVNYHPRCELQVLEVLMISEHTVNNLLFGSNVSNSKA